MKATHAPSTIRKMPAGVVEKVIITEQKGYSKKNRRTDFLVKWRGCLERDATWEREATPWQFEGNVREYFNSVPAKMSGFSSGAGFLAP